MICLGAVRFMGMREYDGVYMGVPRLWPAIGREIYGVMSVLLTRYCVGQYQITCSIVNHNHYSKRNATLNPCPRLPGSGACKIRHLPTLMSSDAVRWSSDLLIVSEEMPQILQGHERQHQSWPVDILRSFQVKLSQQPEQPRRQPPFVTCHSTNASQRTFQLRLQLLAFR